MSKLKINTDTITQDTKLYGKKHEEENVKCENMVDIRRYKDAAAAKKIAALYDNILETIKHLI